MMRKKIFGVFKKLIVTGIAGTMLFTVPVFAGNSEPTLAEQQEAARKAFELAQFMTDMQHTINDLNYDYGKVDNILFDQKIEIDSNFNKVCDQLDMRIDEQTHVFDNAVLEAQDINDKDKREDAIEKAEKAYDKELDKIDKARDKAIEDAKKEKEKADKAAEKERERIEKEKDKIEDAIDKRLDEE